MKSLAIITGASRGIGRRTAEYFLNYQWDVINLSRTACDVAEVENKLIDLNQLMQKQNDISNYLSAKLAAYEQISLIHNACCFEKDSIDNIDINHAQQIFNVNLLAPLLLNQLIIPYMQAQAGSSIIYIGSTLSHKAVQNTASYVISKHASVGMMRATCQDLAEKNIHTCCICPGFTETEMLISHIKNDPAILESIKNMVGSHRLIQPEEIASLIFYAANHAVLNGAIIDAHLGQIER